jgi:4-amino-4-deoxy-L-arabinose transferase-like glycosyltransferase
MQNPPVVPTGSPRFETESLPEGISHFCETHYRWLAALALLLAALNVGYRLDRELVTAWDESLYAASAAEMVNSGNWLVTTFHGTVDYYNSKPPLNIWLIAASFKTFGIGLVPLRLPSAAAAWLTVAVTLWWTRKVFGALPALLSSLVLSTTFAFFYVHSARSGNPDAWLTLAIVLTVIILWSARTVPARLAWLGVPLAAVFMLKGTAVLLPLLIVACVLGIRGLRRDLLLPLGVAAVLFLIPTGAWAVARWQFDRWRFFDAMLNYDFIARTFQQLEGHDHGWLFYLYQLQKDHYDWLAVALVLLVIVGLTRHERHGTPLVKVDRDTRILLGVWALATMLVPTLMATKLPWYLNSFYPVFAIGVALVIVAALNAFPLLTQRRERVAITAMVVAAFALAEGKLMWYSYQARDLSGSVQNFFLESSTMVEGRRVLQEIWDPADQFVLEHIAGGIAITGDPQEIASAAGHDDLLILESSAEGGWTLTAAPPPAATP